MKTGLAPINCTTNKQVCAQKTDNKHLKNYWMLADHTHITICKQTSGQSATESVRITKKQFDALIRWYLQKQ